MCNEMLVIPANRVVEKKRIIGKNGRAKEKERHKGLPKKIGTIALGTCKNISANTFLLQDHEHCPVQTFPPEEEEAEGVQAETEGAPLRVQGQGHPGRQRDVHPERDLHLGRNENRVGSVGQPVHH
jgi:hypothetical protein